jgi:hypothetical protein
MPADGTPIFCYNAEMRTANAHRDVGLQPAPAETRRPFRISDFVASHLLLLAAGQSATVGSVRNYRRIRRDGNLRAAACPMR